MTVTLPWQICSAPSVYCVPKNEEFGIGEKIVVMGFSAGGMI